MADPLLQTPLPVRDPEKFPQVNLSNPSVVKILMAAGECFARSGYQGTSTKEIALKAGVSKSLLHYHFQSKEHILFELQESVFNLVAARLRDISLRGTPSIERALSALDEVWQMLKAVRGYIPLAVELINMATAQQSLRPGQAHLLRQAMDLLEEVIPRLLGPEVTEKLAISPERVGQLLLATLPGFALRLQMDPTAADRAFEDYKSLLAKLVPGDR